MYSIQGAPTQLLTTLSDLFNEEHALVRGCVTTITHLGFIHSRSTGLMTNNGVHRSTTKITQPIQAKGVPEWRRRRETLLRGESERRGIALLGRR